MSFETRLAATITRMGCKAENNFEIVFGLKTSNTKQITKFQILMKSLSFLFIGRIWIHRISWSRGMITWVCLLAFFLVLHYSYLEEVTFVSVCLLLSNKFWISLIFREKKEIRAFQELKDPKELGVEE